jgi:two-component system, chemotaxis family, response regulator Rcp1
MFFTNKTKLLLVDGNERDTSLISGYLHQLDKEVEITIIKDGQSTLDFLNAIDNSNLHTLPDIIIMEIHLGLISGLEILRFIKTKEILKKTPVVLLTSSSSDEHISKAYGSHANCYITKPEIGTGYLGILKKICFFWPNHSQKDQMEKRPLSFNLPQSSLSSPLPGP